MLILMINVIIFIINNIIINKWILTEIKAKIKLISKILLLQDNSSAVGDKKMFWVIFL